jgi:hypothetical protein
LIDTTAAIETSASWLQRHVIWTFPRHRDGRQSMFPFCSQEQSLNDWESPPSHGQYRIPRDRIQAGGQAKESTTSGKRIDATAPQHQHKQNLGTAALGRHPRAVPGSPPAGSPARSRCPHRTRRRRRRRWQQLRRRAISIESGVQRVRGGRYGIGQHQDLPRHVLFTPIPRASALAQAVVGLCPRQTAIIVHLITSRSTLFGEFFVTASDPASSISL